MSSAAQKIYVPFSRNSSFCIFNPPMIYQICDVMMSISPWNRVHFWMYLLNRTLSHQTWPLDKYKHGPGLVLTTYCVWYPHTVPFKWNALFSTKNSKNTHRLGECKVVTALNLEKQGVKIHNCALLVDFLALFCLYLTHALIGQ